MRRDATHMDSVKRWAQYILTHPDWKKHHTEFINAQFDMAYRSIDKLKATPEGKEKIKRIYGIKNEKGYPSIF